MHGDLSAYNVLYLDDTPRMIDLPQATRIDDADDPWPLFHRDVSNICDYSPARRRGRCARPRAETLAMTEKTLARTGIGER